MKKQIFTLISLVSFLASFALGHTIEALFPDVDPSKMDSLLWNETSNQTADNVSLIKTNSDTMEGGYDLPALTMIHQEALAGAKNQIVVDCGAGNGFFSAKLLAAGAAHVLPIEMMKAPANNIPKTIQRYQEALGKKFEGECTVYQGDALKKLGDIGKTFKPTSFCFFNFFHYTSPSAALEILKKSHEIAAEGAILYAVANAIHSRDIILEAYTQGLFNNPFFAGYMMLDRLEDYELYDPNTDSVLNTVEEKDVVAAHPLDPTQAIAPIYLWNGFYDPTKSYKVTKKNKTTPEYALYPELAQGTDYIIRRKKVTKSYFFLDIASIKHLLDLSGWELIEANYFDGDDFEKKIPDFDLATTSRNTSVNVIFKAIKKSNPVHSKEEL